METQVKNGGEGLGLKTDRRFMTDALTALLEEGETLYSPVYGCLMERELFRAANHFGFFGRTDTHLLIAILNPFNGKRIDWTARVPLSVRKATLRRGLLSGQWTVKLTFYEGAPCRLRMAPRLFCGDFIHQRENVQEWIAFLRRWE